MASSKAAGYKGVALNEETSEQTRVVGEHPQVEDSIEPLEVVSPDGAVWFKGQVQEPAYRDKYFAIAFWIHFAAIVSLSIVFGSKGLSSVTGSTRRFLDSYGYHDSDGDDKHGDGNYQYNKNPEDDIWSSDGSERSTNDTLSSVNTGSILAIFFASVLLPPLLAVLSLRTMRAHAEILIQSSLYFCIGFNGFLCVIGIVTGTIGLSVIGGIFALVLLCYARAVWHRIPYAASNVKAAATAVQANMGMALLSFSSLFVSSTWIVIWVVALVGTMQTDFMKSQVHEGETYVDGQEKEQATLSAGGFVIVMLFVLSLHWTLQVIKGTVHTTIAGTIGTWWFTPEQASSFCSKGLTDSFSRTMTYSFGSICLGSLIVAIIEMIRSSLRSQRRRRNILACIAQCLLVWIERIAEYFNRWAFVYVGLYGYSFVEAGKNTMNLFRSRGWTVIISDNLVVRMLAVLCLGIGLVQALLSLLVAVVTGSTDSTAMTTAGWLGFILGVAFSSIMLNVVTSAVDSIIVLYAEAPTEFGANHPSLYAEMASTWTAAWPDVFDSTPVPMAQAEVV